MFPGGALVGCEAGYLNASRIKGSHAAIKTGMLAAEAAFADAEQVVFELSPAELADPALGQKMMQAALLPPDQSLQAQLGAGGIDDQLSMAAALYARADFQGAAAVYENLLGRFPDLHALHAYLALCAYMLDGALPGHHALTP